MSVKDIAFGDLPMELATTRKAIERVPSDKLGWKPHEKNFSLGQLAQHMANLSNWGVMILATDGLDLAEPFPDEPELSTTEEILQLFDERTGAFVKAMDETNDEALAETWTLRMGDQVLSAMPKSANLRSFVISHLVHHRAQLGVYLRLLDIEVPSTYGPSADENPFV